LIIHRNIVANNASATNNVYLGVIPRAVEDRPYNCLGMQFLGVDDTLLPPIKWTQ
jgi:hypothetical protein